MIYLYEREMGQYPNPVHTVGTYVGRYPAKIPHPAGDPLFPMTGHSAVKATILSVKRTLRSNSLRYSHGYFRLSVLLAYLSADSLCRRALPYLPLRTHLYNAYLGRYLPSEPHAPTYLVWYTPHCR